MITNGRDAMVQLAVAGAGLACLARIVGDREPALQRVALSSATPTRTLWLGVHRLVEHLQALQPALLPGTNVL